MIASAKGHAEVVQALLAKAVQVNAKTKDEGITPLMFAVAFGHLPVVQTLVEKGGADISLKDRSERRSALEWAAGRTSLTWAAPGTKESEKAKSDLITNYLLSKGTVVPKMDIVEAILTFAVVPDLTELLSQVQPK